MNHRAIDPLAGLATAFLLGQGAIANLWLIVALDHRFSSQVIWLAAGVLFLSGIREIQNQLRTLKTDFSRQWSTIQQSSLIAKCVLGGIVFLALLEGCCALMLAPGGDAESFYMALAKMTAASHRLLPLPGYESFTQIGLQGELHYAALISIAGDPAAKLFAWSTGLAAALIFTMIGKTVGLNFLGQIIALGCLFTSTAFTNLLADGKVDIFGAAMGLAAYYWVLQLQGDREWLPVHLAGLFTGLAVIAKISYLLPFFPSIVLLLNWRLIKSDRNHAAPAPFKTIVGMNAVFALWCLIAAVPHLVKNELLFGEPLAPFISNDTQVLNQTWFADDVTRWILLTYPFSLVFGKYPMQGGTLTPLLPAFAPLGLLSFKNQTEFRLLRVQLVTCALAGVLLWLALRPSVFAPRYFLASLLVLLIPIAGFAETTLIAESKPRWLSFGIVTCLIAALLAGIYNKRILTEIKTNYFYNRVEYCVQPQSLGQMWLRLNQDTAPGERIFLAIYARYWLRPDLIQCASTSAEVQKWLEKESEADRFQYLYQRGFRYCAIDRHAYPVELDFNQAPGNERSYHITPLIDDSRYALVRIDRGDNAELPETFTRQTAPPAWDVLERE